MFELFQLVFLSIDNTFVIAIFFTKNLLFKKNGLLFDINQNIDICLHFESNKLVTVNES